MRLYGPEQKRQTGVFSGEQNVNSERGGSLSSRLLRSNGEKEKKRKKKMSGRYDLK